MSTNPLHDMNRVYYMMYRQESHRAIIKSHEDAMAAISFVVHVSGWGRDGRRSSIYAISDRMTCSYCDKFNHTYEN